MKGVRVCPECDGTGKTKSERLREAAPLSLSGRRATMSEPQSMTLEEARVALYERDHILVPTDDEDEPWAVAELLEVDLIGPYYRTWPEAASKALGYPVVERDDTAELVEAVLRELQSRGVLVDRYEEVFGAKSFDEVVAALAKRKERS